MCSGDGCEFGDGRIGGGKNAAKCIIVGSIGGINWAIGDEVGILTTVVGGACDSMAEASSYGTG